MLSGSISVRMQRLQDEATAGPRDLSRSHSQTSPKSQPPIQARKGIAADMIQKFNQMSNKTGGFQRLPKYRGEYAIAGKNKQYQNEERHSPFLSDSELSQALFEIAEFSRSMDISLVDDEDM